ncbi:MAG: hypothetical protein GX605_06055 [Chloroflexi bacterium]|nr:hypothetical protein [Chloroflexota bacterium]
MLAVQMIRTLVASNEALDRRLWESIMQITDEQFVAEVPYSRGSIRHQMVHVAGALGRWSRGLKGDPAAREFRPNPEHYPTRASVHALWEAETLGLAGYVAGLDEAALLGTPPGFLGPRWHALLHLVNHGTDHRAQVLRALHDCGAPTFDQDLILHLWPR